MADYYNRAGEPMGLMEWAAAFEDPAAKIVAKTTVGDAEVSTVWLGSDHSFGEGPPLIFETMIFGGEHDQYQWRYSTEEQARTAHERIVEALKQGDDPEGVA
jgi:hypothetical protein